VSIFPDVIFKLSHIEMGKLFLFFSFLGNFARLLSISLPPFSQILALRVAAGYA